MNTRIYCLLVAVMLAVTASAYDFMVGGLCYNYNSDGTSVTVTFEKSGSPRYTSLSGDVEIPSSVTYSGKTYSVTSIGSKAFYGCSGLTSLTIPNSVTEIGSYVFYNCTGLTSVTIPNSVTEIGIGAFDGTVWYDNQPNGLVYAGLVAYKYKGTMPAGTSVTIKDGTKSITGSAFDGCTGLTSVTIPNSVTSIGSSAFYNCNGLTSVTIPNSVTKIGSSAFSTCSSLTSVTIGNSVTYISDGVFYGCSGLTSVTIGNSVTSIGWSAFRGCSSLTSVTIPNSVTEIGSYVFDGCSSLTSVTIGNSVTEIGSNAFRDCTGLTSVTIPNSVTEIGSSAFYNCIGLTSVTNLAFNPQPIEYFTFYDVNIYACKLLVLQQSISLYQAAPYWNDFGTISAIVIGDLNGDSSVNTGDVSALYQALLDGSSDALYDLNGDGQVNTGDVSALYRTILGSE